MSVIWWLLFELQCVRFKEIQSFSLRSQGEFSLTQIPKLSSQLKLQSFIQESLHIFASFFQILSFEIFTLSVSNLVFAELSVNCPLKWHNRNSVSSFSPFFRDGFYWRWNNFCPGRNSGQFGAQRYLLRKGYSRSTSNGGLGFETTDTSEKKLIK